MEPTPQELECIEQLRSGNYIKEQPDTEDVHFLNDATLLSFVRARNHHIDKVATMLNDCIAWRKVYKPYAIKYEEVADILSLKTVFILGHCKRGNPLLYMTPGATNPYNAEKRVQLIVYLMEETHRRGCERLTWIFDWRRFGDRGKDPESSKTREQVMKILQNYYPERLGLLLMVQNPWYFTLIATLLWPFIDARTRPKIHMGVTPLKLREYIDEDQLLVQFGGKREPNAAEMLVGSPM